MGNVSQELKRFAGPDAMIVRSPGRINLIGEHTDYNDGFVLPAAIDKAIYVAVEKNEINKIFLHSVVFKEFIEVELGSIKPAPGHWSTYIFGVVDQLQKRGYVLPGFRLAIDGDVPPGAGLSSSAAVECATAFALNELFNLHIERTELAVISQLAEHAFAGVQCGIMDQFASLVGRRDHVIKLDCRSLTFEYFPLELPGYKIVLFDSQVKHALASTAYNERRQQCEQGVKLLKEKYPDLKSLRDATRAMIDETIDPNHIIYPRCKYVVEENARVLDGCKDLLNGDLGAFGKKMFASHKGLSEDYDVSCPELDLLVKTAALMEGVIGSRMMGGGFGGCSINIIKEDKIEEVTRQTSEHYQRVMGKELKRHIVEIKDGTSIISS